MAQNNNVYKDENFKIHMYHNAIYFIDDALTFQVAVLFKKYIYFFDPLKLENNWTWNYEEPNYSFDIIGSVFMQYTARHLRKESVYFFTVSKNRNK